MNKLHRDKKDSCSMAVNMMDRGFDCNNMIINTRYAEKKVEK